MIRRVPSTFSSISSLGLLGLLAACSNGGSGGSSPPPPPPPVADTTPPDTTLGGAPSDRVNVTTATFTFTATEAGSTFEARLDGAAFAAATSPVTLNGLAEGNHTFEVRARDAAGNVDATPASATWAVDLTPPDTAIDTGPAALVTTTLATFTFSSPDPTAVFQVSVDGGAYVGAIPPYSFNVPNGSHTFSVRSRDYAGNIDATPATFTWVVDTFAPDATITSAPSSSTPVSSATFSFTSPDATATFEVSLDGGAFVAATSPYTPGGLTNGPHTFRVRARDVAGNTGAAAEASFTFDGQAPVGRIVFPPAVSYTEGATLTVRGTASDANGVTSVRVNGVAATSSNGFANWSAQIPVTVSGANPIVVAVTDAAGIETPSADTAVVHNRGPNILLVQGLAFDPTGNRLLIVDQRTANLYAYNAGDRLGRVLADLDSLNSVPGSSFMGSIAVDAANNRAIVAHGPSDRIAAVNLATGAVSVISASPGAGQPTSMGIAPHIALDPVGNRAFVTTDGQTVLAVNLTTGARTIVTSGSVGTGIALDLPGGIAYDALTTPGSPRLLVSDMNFSSNRIIAVNVATGNRSAFSSASPTGTGPALVSPSSLQLDAANNRLLALDIGAHALVAVSLANGNRSYLSGTGVGSGPSVYAQTGLALSPAGRIYSGQQGGEVLEVAPGTLARSIFVGAPLGTGPRILDGRAMILESADSLLYLDYVRESVVRIDLGTGNRSVVSSYDTAVGAGPRLMFPGDMVLDTRAPSPGSRVLVTAGNPNDTLMSVDLATGNRSAVTYLNPVLPQAEAGSMALNALDNRMVFIENVPMMADSDSIYAVDLATGVRTTLSDNVSVGTGPGFGMPADILLTPSLTIAIVSNIGFGGPNGPNYLNVDLGTGNRTIFAPATGPSVGLPVLVPTWMHLDSLSGDIFAINSDPEALFSMPWGSTQRTLLSGENGTTGAVRGTGIRAFGSAIDYDAANRIAYTFGLEGSLIAIDVVSGDRVQVSH